MIRSSVTFYDDQYKFWKSFNSPKIFLACAEYMFEDIEPQGLTEQEKVLFESLRIRMDNQKKKSFAGSCSHGGGRPKKTTEIEIEKQQKNNTKTTEKQEVKDKVEDKDKVKELFNKEDMCEINSHDSVSFDKFWSLYPNKKDKKKAKQKFDRLTLIKKQLAIDGIHKLKQSEQWQKGFIPMPTTYLNGERWEDEVEVKNSRMKEIQEYQQKTRLEEARKLLNHDVIENENSDKNTAFDRRTEINSS